MLTRQLMCHAAADLEANPDLPSEVSRTAPQQLADPDPFVRSGSSCRIRLIFPDLTLGWEYTYVTGIHFLLIKFL